MKVSLKISFIIIALALGIAVIWVSQTKKSLISSKTEVLSSPSSFSLLKTQENLKFNLGTLSNLSDLSSENNKSNLTQELAQILFQGFAEINQGNFDPQKGLKAPEIEKIEEKIPQLGKIEFFQNYYDLKDLKLIAETQENQKNYLSQLKIIFEKFQKTPEEIAKNFENFENTQDPNYLNDFITQYHQPLLKELIQLPTPPSLVDFQLEVLNTLTAEKEILLSLANYQNDPLKAILAAQDFFLLMKKETDLTEKFNQKLKSFNL